MISGVSPGWIRARGSIEAFVAALLTPRDSSARILDVTPEQYLADPCATPSLNATTAHEIVSESPLHGWTIHPRLGGRAGGGAGTKAMNDGSLIHKLLLGKGQEIAIIESDAFRTNAAKDARDAAIADGLLPVLRHNYESKLAIAERVRERCAAKGYVFDGQSEVAIEFDDGGVLCRAMLDHVNVADGSILEVKHVARANPRQIARSFFDFGYDIQYTAHTRALAALRPEFAGRINFTFLFIESEPPYSIVPAKPDGALREIGALRWDNALRIWRECLESGKWPGYCDGAPAILEAPAWLVTEQLGTWQ